MDKQRIEIDLDICVRSGQCSYMYPNLVRMRDDGYPEPAGTDGLTAEDAGEARMLVDACPVGAIRIEGLEQM